MVEAGVVHELARRSLWTATFARKNDIRSRIYATFMVATSYCPVVGNRNYLNAGEAISILKSEIHSEVSIRVEDGIVRVKDVEHWSTVIVPDGHGD